MRKNYFLLLLSLSTVLLLSACGRPVHPIVNKTDTANITGSYSLQPESSVSTDSAQNQEPELLTREQALDIILKHGGLDEKTISDLEIELDYNGFFRRWEYEINFDAGFTEYECEVNAVDGSIIEFRKDW